MRRRAVLIGVGSAVVGGGCMQALSGEQDGGLDGTVEYALADETPGGQLLDHEFALIESTIGSSEIPLVVELSLTNPHEDVVEYQDSRHALGRGVSGGDYQLVWSQDRLEFDDDLGIWTIAEPLDFDLIVKTDTIRSGQTHTNRLYMAVEDPDDPPDGPPEELAFETEYRADRGPDLDSVDAEDGATQNWRFRLTRSDSETDGQ